MKFFIVLGKNILLMAIGIAICCFIAIWLCDINPTESYTWYSGIWHGWWFIPNLLRSLFTDALYKAENYTMAYHILHWIFSIGSTLSIIFKLIPKRSELKK